MGELEVTAQLEKYDGITLVETIDFSTNSGWNWFFTLGEAFDNDELMIVFGNTAVIEPTDTVSSTYDAARLRMTMSSIRNPPST